MLSDEELANVLALGHEQRGVEFKGGGSFKDKALLAKVVRAALGLSNRRDGGYVVIGIDDKAPSSGGPGLSNEDAAAWTNFDDLATWFGEFADPPLRFEASVRLTPGGNRVAVIHVLEFDDVPTLCKRDYDVTLKRGALYTRSHARPETSDTHLHVEMRELLELAIDKGVRRFLERAQRVGLLGNLVTPESTDAAPFEDQLKAFLNE